MNREDIIRMAREADFGDGIVEFIGVPKFERFAALVAAAAKAEEREACARLCDELHWTWYMGDNSGPKECANAIRVRGETK